jgi:RNA polymerase sigma-70 factor (ECF subfamily)
MSQSASSVVEREIIQLMPALRSFAKRFCKYDCDADDLVQETLVKALKGIDKFQPGTSLKSWLFTIMRNAYCTTYKKDKRFVLGLDDMVSMHPSTPASQEWVSRGRELETAINNMPVNFRHVVGAILIDGESYDAVAAKSNCPVGTIKSRVNRAREYLAKRFSDTVETAASI